MIQIQTQYTSCSGLVILGTAKKCTFRDKDSVNKDAYHGTLNLINTGRTPCSINTKHDCGMGDDVCCTDTHKDGL